MPLNESFLPDEERFYSSPKFWRGSLAFVLILIFLVVFWQEVSLIRQLVVAYILAIVGKPVILPLTSDTFRAAFVLLFNALTTIGGYLLLLLWIAQFVLPIQNWTERWKAFKHLCRYTLPFHSYGPAIYVKDGKPLTAHGELDKPNAGVAFLDLRSAVVLEQQYGKSKSDIPDVYFDDGSDNTSFSTTLSPNRWQRIFSALRFNKKFKKNIIVRTAGPGLVFTQQGERIIGWADLRKQSRTRKEVYGCTRDGIEVKANVSTTFTLGEAVEILPVTNVKGDWLVIQFKEIDHAVEIGTNGKSSQHKVIKGFSDELENEDKNEINSFYARGNFAWSINSPSVPGKQGINTLPYVFQSQRVFEAVYSRARDPKVGRLGEWTDLPADVAAEVFRNMLAHETYDYLYRPDDPKSYPMKEFKNRFRTRVRNQGVLGYQIVRRKDGRPLAKDQIWAETDLVFSPPQEFTRFEVLRDRGIKIIGAGFSELIPTSEIIRQQFLDNWRAHWQQETEITIAGHELEVMRILNRERAKAQQDMVYSLSQIFQAEQYTNEALAMMLYQALESAATNPATQRLLPGDTIHMLTNLRQWLLPKDQTSENIDDSSDHEEGSAENNL